MNSTTDKIRLVFGDLTLGVMGEGYRYLFSYQQGGLESLQANGREWIYRAPKPTFWRALTDNDRGSHFHWQSGKWLAADMFIRHIGTTVCVDGEEIELPRPPVNNKYGRDEFCDTFSITFHYETVITPEPKVDVTYSVVPDGAMTVTCHYHGEKGLPEFPCFGWRMVMPTVADGFRYGGLSGETYPDRCLGARKGIYEVKGLPVTPYLVPQECGMHMDNQWLEVTRSTSLDWSVKDVGPSTLHFAADDTSFAFSCLPYTAEELENATHQEELPPPRRTVLCIYGAVRGIGGIDSWGSDVENAFHLSAEQDHVFSFRIEPNNNF